MNPPITPKVRELLDSHGRGIPHFSLDGPYMIDVYPGWPESRRTWWGSLDLGPCKKIVKIWNRETHEFWSEVVD